MLTVIIDNNNKLTFEYLGDTVIKYIPTNDQRRYINEFFTRYKLMCIDEDGNEQNYPVVIHNNVNKTTTTLNTEQLDYVDLYRGVPNSTRYRPNKLMTFEKDREEWLLQRMKRHFKDFDNGKITEQQYKTEIRTLIGNG